MTIPRTEIDQAYRLLFDRMPSQQEAEAAAAQHETLGQLRTHFLQSEEFERKFTRLRAQSEAGQPPALIHLHIPKTAGTTVGEALAREPRLQPNRLVHDGTLDELRALPRGRRRALRFIRGHLSMGAGEALGLPYRYSCLIRRPGPRIFSFYKFIRRSRRHPAHQLLTERDMSFGDYLEYSVEAPPHRQELDNGQIRRLSGGLGRAGLGQEQALLATALHHALSPDMLFGFVEHFDSFVQLLVKEGYLSGTDIEAFNVAPSSGSFEESLAELTRDQRRIYDGYIRWDSYFYEVCAAALLPRRDAGAPASRPTP